MKERMFRPAVAFAPAEAGSTLLKGSARSIPGVHLRDALAAVDALHPGLIERFGGHAMAAGLTLPEANLSRFHAAIEAQVATMLAPELLAGVLASDGALAPSELDRALVDALRLAGPWGQGFPEPLFDGEFRVQQWRSVGGRHLKMQLLADGGTPLPAIQFGAWTGAPSPARVRIAYQLDADDWNGRRGVQLLVRQCEAID
jgi:single-stranded-DNA-specific exonuclease